MEGQPTEAECGGADTGETKEGGADMMTIVGRDVCALFGKCSKMQSSFACKWTSRTASVNAVGDVVL